MAVQKKESKTKKILISAGVVISALIIIFLLKLNFNEYLNQVFDALKAVLVPAALALFIGYLIRPLNNALLKKGINKNWAALITISTFFVILLAFVSLIGFLIIVQFGEIIERVEGDWPTIVNNIDNFKNFLPEEVLIEITDIDGTIQFELVLDYMSRYIGSGNLFSSVFSASLTAIGVAVYWLIMIIMMPVFLFFFLREGGTIMSAMIKVIPKRFYREDIEVMTKLANSSTEKYIRGKLISIGFLFLFFAVAFSITLVVFGSQPVMIAILYGVLFGGIIALLDMIPYIGPAIGIILPIFFIGLSSETMSQFLIFTAILVLIDFAGQNLQKMIIEPNIMSKEVDIHPLAVFSGLLFFGALFGFVGFVIATPAVATIRSIYNYLMGKYSPEMIEDLVDEDLNNDGVIAEVDTKV